MFQDQDVGGQMVIVGRRVMQLSKCMGIVSASGRVDDIVGAEIVVVVVCDCRRPRSGSCKRRVSAGGPEAAAPAGHGEGEE